jgi:hypothetical protein
MRTTRAVTVIASAALWMTLSAATSVGAQSAPEPTAPEPIDAGGVRILEGAGQSEELDEGGSATPFALRLPESSTCPGDSANDQWRVETFVVPESVDPASLVYASSGPMGEGLWPLFDVDTRRYSAELLPENPQPGQPARVQPLPDFSFGVFAPGDFPAGSYRVGVACTYFGWTGKYWQQMIVIEDDVADTPAQFRWFVSGEQQASAPGNEAAVGQAGASPTTDGESSSAGWIWALAAAAAVAVGLLIVRSRSAHRRTTTQAERIPS